MTQIFCCDICGHEEQISMFTCEICGRDICGECIKWYPNKRHNHFCKECYRQGKKLIQAENMEDKRIQEMYDKFSEAWKNIKEIVLNSNR